MPACGRGAAPSTIRAPRIGARRLAGSGAGSTASSPPASAFPFFHASASANPKVDCTGVPSAISGSSAAGSTWDVGGSGDGGGGGGATGIAASGDGAGGATGIGGWDHLTTTGGGDAGGRAVGASRVASVRSLGARASATDSPSQARPVERAARRSTTRMILRIGLSGSEGSRVV